MEILEAGRVRGIVFDLWNTLVYNDHRPNPIIALARAFGLLGQSNWTKLIERGMMLEPMESIDEGIASLSRLLGVSLAEKEMAPLAALWREACQKTRLFKDVPLALERLSGRFRLAILSNTQSFDLDVLDREELASRLPVKVLSCREGRLKPDPTLFLHTCKRLGLPPRETLMVGDNLRDDVLAAEAVGMQALLIRREESPLSFPQISSDRRSFPSLYSLLEALGS